MAYILYVVEIEFVNGPTFFFFLVFSFSNFLIFDFFSGFQLRDKCNTHQIKVIYGLTSWTNKGFNLDFPSSSKKESHEIRFQLNFIISKFKIFQSSFSFFIAWSRRINLQMLFLHWPYKFHHQNNHCVVKHEKFIKLGN